MQKKQTSRRQEEILSAMNYLYNQIEEIDNYPDKSLFFQDPHVIEGWHILVDTIIRNRNRDFKEVVKEWNQRTEPFAAPILADRILFIKFKNLYRAYYDPLYELWMGYSGWVDGECISTECKKILSTERYEKVLDVEDINQHLEQMNNRSLDARYAVYKTLSDIFNLLQAMMNRGGEIIIEQNPSDEDIINIVDYDLRQWTLHYGKGIFRRMKEDLLRHFKTRLTDENRYDFWLKMLREDENALKKAMRGELATLEDEMQEHWGDDTKRKMDENDELMRVIYTSCYTDELFDLRNTDFSQKYIPLLTPDNLEMFYEIIVRRNLIQCEMYPELKTQHDSWLKGINEQQPIGALNSKMDQARRSKLDDMVQFLQKGNWKSPATAENITVLLNTIFGKDSSLLAEEDEAMCEKMWALVEGGRGERKMIVSSNLAGFFSEENLLNGTPKEISIDLFGNDNMVNSINDGKKKHRSNAFEDVVPFLTKYTNKIIRQV